MRQEFNHKQDSLIDIKSELDIFRKYSEDASWLLSHKDIFSHRGSHVMRYGGYEISYVRFRVRYPLLLQIV